jgi:hypothetical protein
MGIDITKIIILVIIIIGFITAILLLRNSINKNCTSGDIYDDKLKKCRIDCSGLTNMSYNSSQDKCVPNCLDGQVFCGTTCIDNNQKCLGPNQDIICNLNEDLCGQGCYNKDTQYCIDNTVYDKKKVCNYDPDNSKNNIICKKDEQCSQDNTKCIQCNKALCKDTCCKDGEYCNNDGTCATCQKEQIVCGSFCCDKGYKCSKDSSCIRCENELCNGSDCCVNGQICTDGGCCNKNNVYKIGDKSYCCKDDLSSDGKCCEALNYVLNKNNGKCMIACSDNKTFCDPSTQFCATSVGKATYCSTIGCDWGSLTYNPSNLPNPNNKDSSIPLFSNDKGDKFYITKQPFLLHRQVYDSGNSKCTSDDCKGRLIEDGIENIIFGEKQTCNGDFSDINLPDSLNSCPLSNPSQCCTDSSNKFTGQVCLDGQSCINGFCTSCVDSECNGNKCSTTIPDSCDCTNGFSGKYCDTCTLPKKSNPNTRMCELYIGNLSCAQQPGNSYDAAVLQQGANMKYFPYIGNNTLKFMESIKNFSNIIFRYNSDSSAIQDLEIKEVGNDVPFRTGDGKTDMIFNISDYDKFISGVYFYVRWARPRSVNSGAVGIDIYLV